LVGAGLLCGVRDTDPDGVWSGIEIGALDSRGRVGGGSRVVTAGQLPAVGASRSADTHAVGAVLICVPRDRRALARADRGRVRRDDLHGGSAARAWKADGSIRRSRRAFLSLARGER